MKKRSWAILALLLAICLTASACSRTSAQGGLEDPVIESTASPQNEPQIPEKLELNDKGIPILKVYDTSAKQIQEMDAESYLTGVLAGEMRNDWPLEALKAQAILARTFVMQFISEKESQYEGADISTDISEAQAYNAELINDNIRKAIEETRGLVMTSDGDFAYAWFHAHAGGKTELPSVGLDYKGGDPAYIAVTDSPDSEEAPDDVKRWTASFSAEAVGNACAEAGVKTGTVTSIEIESRGESGRVERFVVNGKSVSAPSLRIHLGSTELKSTLIESVSVSEGTVTFEGSGYGHGVGLSQWGAYGMAKDGKNAEEIITHYFKNVEIIQLWQ